MVGTLIRRPPLISDFMRTVLDDTSATAARATLGITAGTYTPVLFNTTNLDASTAFLTNHQRIGDTVIVHGLFQADTTTIGVNTVMGMALPVASNFTGGNELGGVAASNGVNTPVAILADTTNDRAAFVWVSTNTGNLSFYFSLVYVVQ